VVINQVNKSWDRNKENMDAYCLEVRKLENKFYGLEFHHIIRDNNVAADVLSKLGSTLAQVPVGVFVHELHAIEKKEKKGKDTCYRETLLKYDARKKKKKKRKNIQPCSQNNVQWERDHTTKSTYFHIIHFPHTCTS
jgi:hypothetical protein